MLRILTVTFNDRINIYQKLMIDRWYLSSFTLIEILKMIGNLYANISLLSTD